MEWLTELKTGSNSMLSTKRLTSDLRIPILESERMEYDIPWLWQQERAEVATFISNKIDFKSETVTVDDKGHYIMIKGSIPQEDVTIINICALHIRVPKYMKQTLAELKGETDSNTVM